MPDIIVSNTSSIKSSDKINSSSGHIEVIDQDGKPLAVMPSSAVHEQRLPSKSVFVLIYSKTGKVYLQRRAEHKALAPGQWDISAATHVSAGEALESAAVRVLKKELNLEGVKLKHSTSRLEEFPDGPLRISLYTAQIANMTFCPNTDEVQDGMFVDEEELQSLYKHFPSKLTPVLVWAIDAGVIFTLHT